MIVKVRGIVLNTIRFKDNALITKVYTNEYGLQSFIVNGVYNKKSKFPPSFFQPLSLLSLLFYKKQWGGLQRVKEVEYLHPFQTIHTDFRKSSIAIFMAEILQKTLKEEVQDEKIFQFLTREIMLLEELPFFPDFHILFLIKYIQLLGFEPSQLSDVSTSMVEKRILEKLMIATESTLISENNHERKVILSSLLRFYAIHIEGFGEMRSIKVLNEIFK
jgi:DNA repair protein RecO (recombination protein O)